MPSQENKEILKGCNQLPGLSERDITHGKGCLSSAPHLSQESLSAVYAGNVMLFPHFQPPKANENEGQRDTEGISYVTGGPTLVTHWELIETEPGPETKSGKVA